MVGMTLGMAPAMRVSPRRWVPAFLSLALLAGGSVAGKAAGADPNEVLDVSHMPRLDGAQEDAAHASFGKLTYTVAGSVVATAAAVKKLLAADGWKPYVRPLDESSTSLLFKKGPRGVDVFFTMAGGKEDRSSVNYIGERLNRDLPFPADATEIVYDGNRPYLSCITAGTVETGVAFFRKELPALGWARLSATEAAARWPDANLDEKVKNGAADYYLQENQLPIVVLLRRRAEAGIDVGIKVAPFALPQELEAGTDVAGLPVPKRSSISSSGADGATRREMKAAVPVEIGTVLAFYRGELAKRKWKEEARGTVLNPDEVVLAYSSAEGAAVLKLGHKYDLTTISLALQVPASVAAAKAKAQKDPSDKANVSASGSGPVMTAAAKSGGSSGGTSDQALEADEDSGLPVPKRHTLSAQGASAGLDGQTPFRRQLDASVPAELAAVLAFYRGELAKREWKETAQGAVVKPDRVMLAFSAPDGPAVLKLGRRNGETTVELALKIPAAAANAGVLPARGQVKLMLGNVGDTEAAITINKQTIKIAPGVGGPQTPNGPSLELPPGKYKYVLKVAGRPVQNGEIEVAADDTWGLMVGPGGGVRALHMY